MNYIYNLFKINYLENFYWRFSQTSFCVCFILSLASAQTAQIPTKLSQNHSTLSQSFVPNGCNITVDAGPDITICAGIGKQINGLVTGGYNSISWDPTDGLSNPNIANPIANPMSTTTYTLIARGTSGNLFLNGGFETGNIAPSTSAYTGYTNINSFAMSTGGYMVMSVPQIAAQFGCNPPIGAFTMAISPTGPGVNFLCQPIPVSTNTLYKIKWKCFGIPYIFGAPPVVELKINGNSVGTLDVASGLCVESDADFTWNSGASTQANLCFSNIGGTGTFSIFSIDDIEFRECCEVKDEVKVTVYELIADIAMPDEINCNNNPMTLDGSGSSSGPNINYEWSTTNGKIESGDKTNKVKISQPGTYTLRVIGEFGCDKKVTVIVNGNTTPPDLTVSNTNIDCKNPLASIDAKSKNTMVSYDWSGPNGYTSTKASNANIKDPGDYEVTITDDYGCKTTKKVTVKDNRTEVFLDIKGDTIQCGEDSIQLIASSVSPKPSFTWKYKNQTISQKSNVFVKDTGWYLVKVVDSLGCFIEDSFRVFSFQTQVPTQIIGGQLNCKNNQTQLVLRSDTSGTILWNGPNGFTSTLKQPFVRDSGWYYLNLTTAGGCKGIDSIYISADFALPDVIISPVDTITCLKTQILISGGSKISNANLSWIGPTGLLGNNSSYAVSDSGDYTLIVESPNGCLNSSTVKIYKIVDTPSLYLRDDTLDCIKKSTILNVNSDNNLKYSWTGPNGFNSSLQFPVISEAGEYQVSVISTHGCARFGIINILIDTSSPKVQINADTINCKNTSITPRLNGDPNITNYLWTGPNGFNSTVKEPVLSSPGSYSLFVTNSRGCTSTIAINLIADTAKPFVILSADEIRCNRQAFIKVNNSVNVNQFSWTGPGGFSSDMQQNQVTIPGWYRMTVTSANGCIYVDSVEVIQKDILPDLTIKDDSLTCTKTKLNLFATSGTQGVSYLWSGPNNFSSTLQNPTVSEPGVYTIKISDSNGCELIKTVTIYQFNIKAQVSLLNIDSLTCKNNLTNISLNANQKLSKIEWSGPNNFNSNSQNITVNSGGKYLLKITNEFGCETMDSITITDYRILPKAQVSDDSINCLRRKLFLSLSTSEPNLSFQWSGPNGFMSTLQNPSINEGGNYSVTITNEFNCALVQNVFIKLDTSNPDLVLSADTLTCLRSTVPIKAGTSLQGFNISWSGPNGFTSMFPQTIVKDAGLYTCTLTNPRSKCQTTKSIMVLEDTNRIRFAELFKTDASCGLTNGRISILKVTGGTPSFTFSIDNGLHFLDQTEFTNLASGKYNIQVKDKNGCVYLSNITIDETAGIDISLPPTIEVLPQDNTQLNLLIQSGNPFSINWSPSDQLSCNNCINPKVIAIKDQLVTVIVIDENGCADTASVLIKVRSTVDIYTPNIFSPNDDGINDYFFIYSNGQSVNIERLSIFSRWGELVFDKQNFISNSEKDGWDGNYQGKKMTSGVFVYRISYLKDGETKTIFGDITLMR